MGDAHPAAEKADKPLKRDWAYGAGTSSRAWRRCRGVDREKVAHVMLEVVLGLDRELASRGLHQLRTGEGGRRPQAPHGRRRHVLARVPADQHAERAAAALCAQGRRVGGVHAGGGCMMISGGEWFV